DRELVGLQLLGDDRPPEVASPRELLRRALVLRDRRHLAPRQVAHLPLGALRQLVVAEDAGEVAVFDSLRGVGALFQLHRATSLVARHPGQCGNPAMRYPRRRGFQTARHGPPSPKRSKEDEMHKLLLIGIAGTAVDLAGAFGSLGASAQAAKAPKTVVVAMRDPGCHWFQVGTSFRKTLSVQ